MQCCWVVIFISIYLYNDKIMNYDKILIFFKHLTPIIVLIILLIKTTAMQTEVALSYHKVRGQYFLADIFVVNIVILLLFSKKGERDGDQKSRDRVKNEEKEKENGGEMGIEKDRVRERERKKEREIERKRLVNLI